MSTVPSVVIMQKRVLRTTTNYLATMNNSSSNGSNSVIMCPVLMNSRRLRQLQFQRECLVGIITVGMEIIHRLQPTTFKSHRPFSRLPLLPVPAVNRLSSRAIHSNHLTRRNNNRRHGPDSPKPTSSTATTPTRSTGPILNRHPSPNVEPSYPTTSFTLKTSNGPATSPRTIPIPTTAIIPIVTTTSTIIRCTCPTWKKPPDPNTNVPNRASVNPT